MSLISLEKTVTIINVCNKYFALNLAQYYPPKTCFHRAFLFGVFTGTKKLFPLDVFEGSNYPNIQKEKNLSKQIHIKNLLEIMNYWHICLTVPGWPYPPLRV